MERTGVQARHRAPARYEPAVTYFWAGMLLILAFGMSGVGVADAHGSGHTGWSWFFLSMLMGSTGLYFWNVKCWLSWINLTGD